MRNPFQHPHFADYGGRLWGDRHMGAHKRHGEHGRGRGRRPFDYGELRLLVIALLAEAPSHGYELIKSIEDRFGGSYSPSPGVIYPTLSWLEDMGYARVEPDGGNRKLYHLTDEGEAFLTANREAADELLARRLDGHRGHAPMQVRRAMENLKTALRLRIREDSIDGEKAASIAAIIDDAAKQIENL